MIIGAHAIIYSKDPDRDRAFLRDVLKLKTVDGGGGYLIFGLPSAEASFTKPTARRLHNQSICYATMLKPSLTP